MIDQQKKEIRVKIKELKKKVTLEEKKRKSEVIFEQVEKRGDFKNAQTIMAYWSMDDEVFTHNFVQKWYQHKKIILPSVKGDKLELRVFKGVENMRAGEAFGILEPTDIFEGDLSEIDLVIVPGVAFDIENNRLGRGKAYYDKLLKNTGAVKIGVCFDFQLFDKIPADEYDIKMDLVIADKEYDTEGSSF
ncbi:MAG TPA: 5-formyltetrahydrofolate cyclo-ligase [Bacteroidales bacterium]|nr:5-formyltetrahydrofolate cyclo-ligase [Bacteroidales bacterium]